MISITLAVPIVGEEIPANLFYILVILLGVIGQWSGPVLVRQHGASGLHDGRRGLRFR